MYKRQGVVVVIAMGMIVIFIVIIAMSVFAMLVVFVVIIAMSVFVMVVVFVVIITVCVFVVVVIFVMIIVMCMFIIAGCHPTFYCCVPGDTTTPVERKKLLRLIEQCHGIVDQIMLFVGTGCVFETDEIVPWGFQFEKYLAVVNGNIQKGGTVFMAAKFTLSLGAGECR